MLASKTPASPAIRRQLEAGLFGSVPIFLGGVFNSIAIAGLGVWRQPLAPFVVWLGIEIFLGMLRLPILVIGRRALKAGKRPPLAMAALLSSAWAASIGFGSALSLTSGDWVLTSIVCLSVAAMVSGICLRNFGTPRLAALMVLLALLPATAAGMFTSEPIVTVISAQLPIFIVTIFAGSFQLHRMMVSRMTALNDLERSERLNRTILASSPDFTAILDPDWNIVFCNRSYRSAEPRESLHGASWLELLHPEDRAAGKKALDLAARLGSANLTTRQIEDDGQTHWFDVIANRIVGDSERILLVARDITHQKQSEERALWMARHDALTKLPNRTVLSERLDAILSPPQTNSSGALLLLDVDNFKAINDTLGHDAGDRLLATFAERLTATCGGRSLVARLGGDEFAILIPAAADADIRAAGSRIYAALEEPFAHRGRLLACGASIGASRLWRDGIDRSEVMKAADIALYAAKSAGRGQLRLFDPAMMTEIDHREAIVAEALAALKDDRIVPCFQPKLAFGTLRIVGFEALLRWKSVDGPPASPDDVQLAFDDPRLSALLGERMMDRTLAQVASWLRDNVPFGHVAVNLTAADFRREGFVDGLIARLHDWKIPPSCLQIEVTETVFLGRGAGYIEAALRSLSDNGIRIALDDFGTGHASLSHLNQFPIDLLKIDRSFVHELGRSAEPEAICAAIINLGHCLGMEVIAEGVETATQEAILTGLGCDFVQGFRYAPAIPAEAVPPMLIGQNRPAHQAAVDSAIALPRVLRKCAVNTGAA